MTPRRFKHFQILELLGRGGMGEVYLAQDGTLERKVALKFLPRDLLRDPSAQGRLLDEARSVSQVQHPNIAVIHSIEEDGGIFALCMEYVDGRTLREVILEGPIALHRITRIGAEIAAAMQAAHEKEIVHRDLKPANVMINRRGEVKVMDFGLALRPQRVVDTMGPNTYGTVQYMSPEQARGERLDPRSDIFSFGSLLYELITGRPPFTGANDLAILNAIISREPEPMRELRRDVPPVLEQVVRGCMAKDPAQRWPSMQSLLDELRYVEPVVDAGPKDLISELSTGLSDPRNEKPHLPVNHGTVGRRATPRPPSGEVPRVPASEGGAGDLGFEIPEGFVVQSVRERGAPPTPPPAAESDQPFVIQSTREQWHDITNSRVVRPSDTKFDENEVGRPFVPSSGGYGRARSSSRPVLTVRTGEHAPLHLERTASPTAPSRPLRQDRDLFVGADRDEPVSKISRAIRPDGARKRRESPWKHIVAVLIGLALAAAAAWAILQRAVPPSDGRDTPAQEAQVESPSPRKSSVESRPRVTPPVPSPREATPGDATEASSNPELGPPPILELPPDPGVATPSETSGRGEAAGEGSPEAVDPSAPEPEAEPLPDRLRTDESSDPSQG